MGIWEIFLLAVGLSMDAFAVSVCKGLSVQRLKPRHGAICGAYFGGFQALMPLIGWLLGSQFEGIIKSVDHWIAFGLLVLIGANMVRESFSKDDEPANASFGMKALLQQGTTYIGYLGMLVLVIPAFTWVRAKLQK